MSSKTCGVRQIDEFCRTPQGAPVHCVGTTGKCRNRGETVNHGLASGCGTYVATLSHCIPETACFCHGVNTHTSL